MLRGSSKIQYSARGLVKIESHVPYKTTASPTSVYRNDPMYSYSAVCNSLSTSCISSSSS